MMRLRVWCRRYLIRFCASSLRQDLWRFKVRCPPRHRHLASVPCFVFPLSDPCSPYCTEARPQWDNRELEDLRRTAHSMKGSSGYLKADALIESSIVLMTAAEVIIHLITEPFSCVGLTDGRHTRVYVHRQLLLAMRVMCQMHWCVACAVCVYLHRDE
jgi:hypothetical protein